MWTQTFGKKYLSGVMQTTSIKLYLETFINDGTQICPKLTPFLSSGRPWLQELSICVQTPVGAKYISLRF